MSMFENNGEGDPANEARITEDRLTALESRLDQLPPAQVRTVVVRAALRLLPLVASNCERLEDANLCLAGFRAGFISWSACLYSSHDLRQAARAAAKHANVFAVGKDHAVQTLRTIGRAARLLAEAHGSVALPVAEFVRSTINAADWQAGSDAVRQVWDSIEADMTWLTRASQEAVSSAPAQTLMSEPLWLLDVRGDSKYQANFPPWARDAFDAFANSELATSGDWEVWARWYRAILPNSRRATAKSAFGENADIAIAGQSSGFWNRSPDEVMADVRRLAGGKPIVYVEDEEPQAPEHAKPAEEPTANQEPQLTFLSDVHDARVDYIGRARLAFVLAGRLNRIWDSMNDDSGGSHGRHSAADTLSPGFVVHIDAPWGGGKTSFAGFLTYILNPYRLRALPDWLVSLPMKNKEDWPDTYHRPWHIVSFNAWRHQHVSPPWWVFYEAIRQQCAQATASETNQQEMNLPQPLDRYGYACWAARRWSGFWNAVAECWWRVWTPAFGLKAVPALAGIAVVFGLFWFDLIQLGDNGIQLSDASKMALGQSGEQTLLVTVSVLFFGGPLAFILAVVSAFTQTLFPGTPEAAKNYSLGSGDPLERFRRHFASSMKRFNRPILVVVDDLDRCAPEYVVELVRGMQTILVSPRVIFVILGDRDWIEQAFSKTHDAMKGIDVGPEHAFGGRFVEKAIQFSLILPELSELTRQAYVRRLLGLQDVKETDEAKSGQSNGWRPLQAEQAIEPPPGGSDGVSKSKEATRADPVEAAQGDVTAGQQTAHFLDEVEAVLAIVDYSAREAAAMTLRDRIAAEATLTAQQRDGLLHDLRVRLSYRSAADESVQRATSHRIEALAPLLPANPRQIKRIINAISLMQEAARLEHQVDPYSPKWQVMVRWIVLMNEWPKTWFTLSRYPALADRMLGRDVDRAELPVDHQSLVRLLQAKETAMKLLRFSNEMQGWRRIEIDSEQILWLRELVPATSGRLLDVATTLPEATAQSLAE